MTEPNDTDLRTVFRDFAETASPYVRPPGADLAQQGARVRIRNRRLAATLAAVVAILVPAALIALGQWGRPNSLPVPPATDTPVTITPSGSPTPSPSPTVTGSPTLAGQETRPDPGPGELANTTLTLSWSDPNVPSSCKGDVTHSDGLQPGILSTMPFDVDHDGNLEIVASIVCRIGQWGPQQLVAVEPGATPAILGVVLETAGTDEQGLLDPPDSEGVATIGDYGGLSDGTIRVDGNDRVTCCGKPLESAVLQQRAYGWSGSSFEQVGGPTTFFADPSVADLVVTVPTLDLSAPVDGYRSGTIAITIQNNGPQTATSVSAYIDYWWSIAESTGGDWGSCSPNRGAYTLCGIGDIAAGQTITLTLPVRRESGPGYESRPFAELTGSVQVRTGIRPSPLVVQRKYPTVTFGVSAA